MWQIILTRLRRFFSPPPKPWPKCELIGWDCAKDVQKGEIYRFIYSLFIHQDNLSWNRTQVIMTIEAATLAGAFVLGNTQHTALMRVLLISGSFVLFLLWRLIVRDQSMRDHLRNNYLDKIHDQYQIRISSEVRECDKGRNLILAVLIVLLILNAVVCLFGSF
jgi:hypothetical protein